MTSLFLIKLSIKISSLMSPNTILIFLLYAVWWKDFGIQSSFRYIMNVFYLLFIGLIKNIVNLEKKV